MCLVRLRKYIYSRPEKDSVCRKCWAEQEDELVEVILDTEKRLFGLNRMHVRRLGYRYCEANRVPHNFNHTKELAGND